MENKRGQKLLIAISSTFFDRMARFLAWWLIFSRSTPIYSKIEDWKSFQNVLTYTCGVSFPRFFWGGEFEFGDDLMLRSQLRSLTSSNDLP